MPVLGSYPCRHLRSPSQLVSWAKETPKATERRICSSSNPMIASSPPGLWSYPNLFLVFVSFVSFVMCIFYWRYSSQKYPNFVYLFTMLLITERPSHTLRSADLSHVSSPTYYLSYSRCTILRTNFTNILNVELYTLKKWCKSKTIHTGFEHASPKLNNYRRHVIETHYQCATHICKYLVNLSY